MQFISVRIENIVEKGEMVTSIFSFFHTDFTRLLSQCCEKSELCGKELTHSHTMTPFDAPGKQAF